MSKKLVVRSGPKTRGKRLHLEIIYASCFNPRGVPRHVGVVDPGFNPGDRKEKRQSRHRCVKIGLHAIWRGQMNFTRRKDKAVVEYIAAHKKETPRYPSQRVPESELETVMMGFLPLPR